MSRSATVLLAFAGSCAMLNAGGELLAQQAATASATRSAEVDIGIDEVTRGQTGHGLSVFAGSEPERFDVEVVGVLREMDPGVSFIVARLSGKGLEESGVVAGMSGSPVYLDDRVAGAVAFSWAFTNEALGLITPIAAMRRLSTLEPGAAAAGSVGLSAPSGASFAFGPTVERLLAPPEDPSVVLREIVAEQLGVLNAPSNFGQSAALVTTLGFGEGVRGMLQAAPAGRVAPGDLPELGAGSAVAGVLIDGDLKLAVGGTVTQVEGDEVLAMGHPWRGVGPLSLPMAAVDVVGVVSRVDGSVRLSNIGPVVGAFDQDRAAGLRGRVGEDARTVPMTITVETPSGENRRYDLRLADLPVMLPSLVGVPTLQALESASYSVGESGLDMTGTLRLRGHDDVPLRQVFDGSNPGTSAALYLILLVGALVNSDHEKVELESIELTLRQAHAPRTVSIERAQASSGRVRAGDTVEVVFDLKRHRGDRFQETLKVEVPADRRPGRYYLFVGDGVSVDAARLQLLPARASSLAEELAQLRSFLPQNRLAALGVVPARGLIVEGRPMPDLPATVRSIWRASSLQGEPRPLNLAIVSEHGRNLDAPLDGLFRLDLEILPGEAP